MDGLEGHPKEFIFLSSRQLGATGGFQEWNSKARVLKC